MLTLNDMNMELLEQLLQSWNRVVEQFSTQETPLIHTVTAVESTDLETAWMACLSSVQAVFTNHYGSSEVEKRFQIPQDYTMFMQAIGGGWKSLQSLQWHLFDAKTVASQTIANFRVFVLSAEEGEPICESGFWLSIGEWSDKHEYLLCCDRPHPKFGAVLDGHDSHPWLDGAESCYQRANSFLEWLESHKSSD
ncbi:MAG: SMI1/KNR4 family protein [Desertifilum sp. SIO1I2]|nr:SMI1/KNR4 family protein [Desertifilum sp. SIO1I2]